MNTNFIEGHLYKLSLKAFSVNVYTFMSRFPLIFALGGVK